METRLVNRISLNSRKSNVLSSSPKYNTPSLMLLLLIQLNAARRFDTPRGMVFWDLYRKGMGDDRCTNGIPANGTISKEAFNDDGSLTHSA